MGILDSLFGGGQTLVSFLVNNSQKVYLWFGNQFDAFLLIVKNVAGIIKREFNNAIAVALNFGNYVLTKAIAFTVSTKNFIFDNVLAIIRLVDGQLRLFIRQVSDGLTSFINSVWVRAISVLSAVKTALRSYVDAASSFIQKQVSGINLSLGDLIKKVFSILPWSTTAIGGLGFLGLARLVVFVWELFPTLQKFVANPMSFWSEWALPKLMDFIMDLLASEIDPGDGRMERPIFTNYEDVQ